jgi:hypothetical protein
MVRMRRRLSERPHAAAPRHPQAEWERFVSSEPVQQALELAWRLGMGWAWNWSRCRGAHWWGYRRFILPRIRIHLIPAMGTPIRFWRS